MRRLLLLILPFLLACESATAPVAELSKAEALAALRALQSMSATTDLGAVREATPALRGESSSAIETTDFDTDCPAGGRYEATIARGATNGTDVVLGEITEWFLGCTVTDSGRTWRFDSDPDLRTRITLRFADRAGASTTMTTIYAGAFRVESEGIVGRCVVDLRYTLDVETVTGSVEGTICGQAVTAADGVVLPSGFSLRR
jgi:hypothetical protein